MPTHGPPRAGTEAELLLVVPIDVGAPVLEADAGALLSEPEQIRPGVWSAVWRAPPESGAAALVVRTREGEEALTVLVAEEPEPGFAIRGGLDAPAGARRPVSIVLAGPDLPPPDALSVEIAEGEITARTATAGGVVLSWQPLAEPFPRAVPIAVWDARKPGAPPLNAVISLWARPRIPVQTEPGNTVTLRVGGRDYGPFVADEAGVANAQIQVRAGDELATVEVSDAAGNVQQSLLTLGGDRAPRMLLLPWGRVVPGLPAPPMDLLVTQVSGRAWRGPTPSCTTAEGVSLHLTQLEPGRWRMVPPAERETSSLHVRCALGSAARVERWITVEGGIPSRLALQASPDQLSAASPRSLVQVYLQSALGDRLPVGNISVEADRGELQVAPLEPGATLLRARYDGVGAIPAGSDGLRATWSREPGAGDPWYVALSGEWSPAGIAVRGRPLDSRGLPLAGVTVSLELEGERVAVSSDASGWAEAVFPAGERAGDVPALIGARCGSVMSRDFLTYGERRGAVPGRPDLETTLTLPIHSSPVRSVELTTEPHSLMLGRDAGARVILRLVDGAGQPVAGEDVRLVASEGTITAARQRADGAYEAFYTPPVRPLADAVRLTAQGEGFSDTTTELAVIPRDVRLAPGIAGGVLLGRRGLRSSVVGLETDIRLPLAERDLHGRVSIALYGETATATDDVVDRDVTFDIELLPIGAGVVARQERRSFTGWVGATVVVAPYRIQAVFGQSDPTGGWGVVAPGFSALTGAGWRTRSGELQLQVAYLFLAMDEAWGGWQGPIGGAMITGGYKLLY